MKRVIALLAAAALSITVLCGMTSVPESVEARTDGEKTEIVKVYRLAPEEDPSLLIEEPFEQEGYLYEYESMVKEEEIQEQSKVAETSLTVETETDELAEIIKELPGSVPYSGTDGYSGKLILNPGSITTEAAGYATSSFTVSDTRVYTDLAYNDNSLIPQTVTKNGMTLTLSNVSWQGQGGTGANGSLIPTAYTATAYYSAVGSRRYATGYVNQQRNHLHRYIYRNPDSPGACRVAGLDLDCNRRRYGAAGLRRFCRAVYPGSAEKPQAATGGFPRSTGKGAARRKEGGNGR